VVAAADFHCVCAAELRGAARHTPRLAKLAGNWQGGGRGARSSKVKTHCTVDKALFWINHAGDGHLLRGQARA
jgi:hypothetical protein